ncbi:uncharacterized protein [Salminus brasiliensis]|uniref:uncharacterized protein n=1 Tax=Salminus brasiliensis TaxID=930266 RepID=UPI003B839BAF
MSHIEEAKSKVSGTELRAVVLGWHKSGKTSVINTILGPGVTVAVSGQCVKKEGRIHGRKVTLVDTPGWWKDCSIKDSPELAKQAIMRSVTLCPPGPHAFLLVVGVDLPFMEKYMESLEQRMELLSERVWAHTIVLFTRGDTLKKVTIDRRIQRGGKTLQRLLQKCGNRYHVFDNTNRSNRAQVSELLEKIEDVVRGNGGGNFEIDLEELRGLQRKWEDVQRRATARQSKVQEERSTIKQKAYLSHLKEVRVVLLGWVFSGKSSVGNTILNQERFVTGSRTTKCTQEQGSVAGRKMTVLDTPGWWKFFSPDLNPDWVQAEILKSIKKCRKYPQAMLVVLPADTSFTEEQKRIIEENMAIFGERIWRHTIVLFTYGDFLGDASIEHYIESEEALQWLVEKCGNRYHVFDNKNRGDHAQVIELLEKIEEMVAGNCLYRYDTPGVELHEETTNLQLVTYEENQVKDILNLLQREWNRRAEEFRENMEKLCTEFIGPPRKSNQSRTPPPEFCSEDDELPVTPKMFGPECEMDRPLESQVSVDLTEQLLPLLDREWSRIETVVMEKVRATLLQVNRASGVSSEVGEEEIQESLVKVLWWLPGCRHEKGACGVRDDKEESSSDAELRAVVLGWHKSGKTSVINTILGPGVTVAVSGQCVKKEEHIHGRKVTLVDTPGWWKDCSIKDSPELAKQAIMRSVSLCPPGPHAFLLVVEADVAFTEKHMRTLEQRMELLSERVWAHTIVLFTRGDTLKKVTIDRHIQRGGKTLQRLLQKCGNRYHAFDNTTRSNHAQVSELLEKIEDVVRGNGGGNFEIDLEELRGLQRKWEDVQRRATARQSKVQEERSTIKQKAYLRHLEEVRVVLLGWVFSGKSSVGNTILNQERFVTGSRTTKCIQEHGSVAGRKVTVLDTPGWWKFFSPDLNPDWVQAEILKSIKKGKKFPQAMLVVLPADTSFTEEQKRIIEENMAIFGERIWRHTIVLFTYGDFLGDASIEHYIESEGEALQWLVEKCGNRYHVFDNKNRGDHAQVIELLEKIEEMVAGNCLFRPGVSPVELQEKKTKLQLDPDEQDQIQEILKSLRKEWNRRAEEFRENVENVFTEFIGPPRRSNRSRTPPPEFIDEDKSDTSETFGSLSKMDNPQKLSKKVRDILTGQLPSLLEREWSRQESMVMDKMCATLLKVKDVSSEVCEKEIQESVAKVSWWLPGCEPEKDTCRSSDDDDDDEEDAGSEGLWKTMGTFQLCNNW